MAGPVSYIDRAIRIFIPVELWDACVDVVRGHNVQVVLSACACSSCICAYTTHAVLRTTGSHSHHTPCPGFYTDSSRLTWTQQVDEIVMPVSLAKASTSPWMSNCC